MHHLSPSLRFVVNHWPAVFGILAIPHLTCVVVNDGHGRQYALALGVLTVGYIVACFVASWKRNVWALAAMPGFLASILVVRAFEIWPDLSDVERIDFLSYATREILTVMLACFLFVLFDLWKDR